MRILVVEDEPAVQAVLRRFLLSAGHEVLEAESEWKALELALSERVDLAIVDIALAGQDGIAIMAGIRRLQPGIPFIVVSGSDRNEIFDRLEARGLRSRVWWLGKPFVGEDLLRTIGRALAG